MAGHLLKMWDRAISITVADTQARPVLMLYASRDGDEVMFEIEVGRLLEISATPTLVTGRYALGEPENLDVTLMARAIQGEGAALFGTEAETVADWIGHTVLNLFEAPWQAGRWGTPGAVVADRFPGYVSVLQPMAWAREAAKKCLARDKDITGGAEAMLRQSDLERHKWPPRDDLLIRSFQSAAGFELRFYSRWAEEWI